MHLYKRCHISYGRLRSNSTKETAFYFNSDFGQKTFQIVKTVKSGRNGKHDFCFTFLYLGRRSREKQFGTLNVYTTINEMKTITLNYNGIGTINSLIFNSRYLYCEHEYFLETLDMNL